MVCLSSREQALISYQDDHMLPLTLAGRTSKYTLITTTPLSSCTTPPSCTPSPLSSGVSALLFSLGPVVIRAIRALYPARH